LKGGGAKKKPVPGYPGTGFFIVGTVNYGKMIP